MTAVTFVRFGAKNKQLKLVPKINNITNFKVEEYQEDYNLITRKY